MTQSANKSDPDPKKQPQTQATKLIPKKTGQKHPTPTRTSKATYLEAYFFALQSVIIFYFLNCLVRGLQKTMLCLWIDTNA